ncbi:MAG TPA: nucleotidyl transferase AbiEii/AbiGii toxin family protein [Spirochaetota bacterium]|nr:nucleotidyl transferase AbiEii/AbiGii toxin family protein [Spirochaetota bacterium]
MSEIDLSKSVHQKLMNKAKEANRPFNELLQYYAMERFLYRLSSSRYSDRFILKGALMFILWDIPGMQTRPTRDIDLLGIIDNDLESMKVVFSEISKVPVVDDGIQFNPDDIDITAITEEADYRGTRIKIKGNLGNAKLSLQIDIGFGDIVLPEPVKLKYPSILSFPAPEIKGYSPESVIAEKLQAMVKLGIINSRMKDFYDIRVMSEVFNFDGRILSDSIRSTFNNRETEIPVEPVFLQDSFREDPLKQTQWKAFIRKTGVDNKIADFKDTVSHIEGFIKPVLTAIVEDKSFDYKWKSGGPWISKSS